jgi:hypothetical protein
MQPIMRLLCKSNGGVSRAKSTTLLSMDNRLANQKLVKIMMTSRQRCALTYKRKNRQLSLDCSLVVGCVL